MKISICQKIHKNHYQQLNRTNQRPNIQGKKINRMQLISSFAHIYMFSYGSLYNRYYIYMYHSYKFLYYNLLNVFEKINTDMKTLQYYSNES